MHRGQNRRPQHQTDRAGYFRRSGDRDSAGGTTDDGPSDATAVSGALPDGVIDPHSLLFLQQDDGAAFHRRMFRAGNLSKILSNLLRCRLDHAPAMPAADRPGPQRDNQNAAEYRQYPVMLADP